MIIFIRAKLDDKRRVISAVVNDLKIGNENSNIYFVNPKDFGKVSGMPFSYWVPNKVRSLFQKYGGVDGDRFTARVGIQSSDDYRFVRTKWEVLHSGLNDKWFPYAKGGESLSTYADIYLVVNWEHAGSEMKAWNESLYGGGQHWSRNLRSVGYSFRPGLTWTQRTNRLGIRVMPEGCMFGVKGPAIFSATNSHDDLLALVALTESKVFNAVVKMQMASASFDVGVIQKTPLPILNQADHKFLSDLGGKLWESRWLEDIYTETSAAFHYPKYVDRMLDLNKKSQVSTSNVNDVRREVDEIAYRVYEIDEVAVHQASLEEVSEGDSSRKSGNGKKSADKDDLYGLLSWLVGVAFGRFSLGALEAGELKVPQPFDSIETKSPAQRKSGEKKLHHANGVLVDDPNSKDDIVAIINGVIDKLGIKVDIDLRKWIRKDFFKQHIKQYSMSRREAPIYWPLQLLGGKYTLWLYFPEITSQTLFVCINDFIDPKISDLNKTIDAYKNKTLSKKDSDFLYDDFIHLINELKNFREEIQEITRTWDPHLDDGVPITASALYKYFPNSSWKKKLTKINSELHEGGFPWSRAAYNISPGRVIGQCTENRSLAIAHGLDKDLWEKIDLSNEIGSSKKYFWQPKEMSEDELNTYIKNKIAQG